MPEERQLAELFCPRQSGRQHSLGNVVATSEGLVAYVEIAINASMKPRFRRTRERFVIAENGGLSVQAACACQESYTILLSDLGERALAGETRILINRRGGPTRFL